MISAPGTSSPRPTFSENIRFDQPVRIYFGNPSEVLEGDVASEAEDGLPSSRFNNDAAKWRRLYPTNASCNRANMPGLPVTTARM